LIRLAQNLEVQTMALFLHVSRCKALQLALQLRITREPAGTTRLQPTEIHPARAELERQLTAGQGRDLHQPSTHFPGGQEGISARHFQHHPIARFERLPGAEQQAAIRLHGLQTAQPRPSLFAPAAVHQFTMIHPIEPAMAEAPGETELKLAAQVIIGVRYSFGWR